MKVTAGMMILIAGIIGVIFFGVMLIVTAKIFKNKKREMLERLEESKGDVMSGIKGVIKYISQLLILSSFSIIFLPIICLKCYEEKSEISIFKFMQWSIGKSTKSFLDADMEFVIGRQMKIYIVCALIWVMVTVIFTIIILLVQSQLSYYIAIVAQLFTILSGGLIYLML